MPRPDARAALLALEQIGIKLGLDQIRGLVGRLDHPEHAYPSIIIAGTNGKGSVTAMVERGLRAAGHRTGRFTSPHLVDLEERFAVNGEPIAPAALDDAAARVLAAARHLPAPPSFFEATTAIALAVFRQAAVDVAVLEVGLGGRLDATNVVDAPAAVITSIDVDHQQYLGHTVEEIAREKAGVIKPRALVVLAANPPEVDAVVRDACAQVGAALRPAHEGITLDAAMVDGRARLDLTTPERTYRGLRLALAGRHQIDNALASVRLLEWLDSASIMTVTAEAITTAIEDVEWPARLESIQVGRVAVLLDGAHNPAGARALSDHVWQTHGRRLPMVVGAMRDKALEGLVLALAPAASRFVFTAASTSRAATPAELAAVAARIAPDVPARTEIEPLRAVELAGAAGAPVVVAGSLFLAGEIRAARS